MRILLSRFLRARRLRGIRGRGFFRISGLLTSCLLAASCAGPRPRPASPEPPTVAKVPSAPAPAPTPQPRKMVAHTPPSALPTPSPQPTPPPPLPADQIRAKAIAARVQHGELLEPVGSVLRFRKLPPTAGTPSSLFENAIILGQLRYELKKIPNVPDGISSSATVKNATADLSIPPGLPASTSAAIIDAALGTEGIAEVKVRFEKL